MAWIDSHCHIDFPELSPVETLLQDLKQAHCDAVLLPSVANSNLNRVVDIARKAQADGNSAKVYFALGLHPYFHEQHSDQHLERLTSAIDEHKPQAVGEVGIDYLLPEETRERQWQLLNAQLDIAIDKGLPVVIHCRKAHDLLSKLLKQKHFTNGGIIHAFSGSVVQAQRYLDLGFVLGLGGALTYPRAKAMQKMVRSLPDHAYVLETDSPDMPPAFAPSQINTPLNVPKIAEHIADLRLQPVQRVYADSSANFYRALKL
ncbi:TatD family hydrolase [Bermanella marisrubri]|uniref:Hydrolase, TatD family protein n=1 Tax=Bermanella marisrubri TaxID=207949 RepID=Q1N2Q2_9GAMM|nr:TatD family hydrolase [Bermanella marisrubri]EAT12617.1 hydrolase, TatD family protein [Oceanobacter sp. RED65] [Bermanella marisrubri]QIZ84831.1 TatD family hydrolase [Bermanella marisrubri]